MGARRAMFWLSVAGVAIVANYGIEVLADRFPNLGLTKFVAYTHRGAN